MLLSKKRTKLLLFIGSGKQIGDFLALRKNESEQHSQTSTDQIFTAYSSTHFQSSSPDFEKSQKEYKLEMKEKDNISYELTEDTDDIKQNIIVKDDLVKVNRTYLNSYVQNIDKVWNNIAINEKKVGNKIEGFEVLKVNQDSVFAKKIKTL